MKLRFQPVPPSRADGTLLPAALVAALMVMAVAQLAITDAVELPALGPIGVGAPLPLIRDPDLRGVPGVILSRPLFAPPATASATGAEGAGAAPADPLDGAAFVGTVGVGRFRYAVVQVGGAIRRIPIGGRIAGWRLIGLGANAAVLARGSERVRRSYGASAQASGSSADEASSEDQQ